MKRTFLLPAFYFLLSTFAFAQSDVRVDENGNVLNTKKITFKPTSAHAGLNSGSLAGDPSSLANGDLWYNSTSNQFKARINGVSVALGAGGGGGGVTDGDKGDITVSGAGTIWNVDSGAINFSELAGRASNAQLPLGAQLFDNAGTPKLALDLNVRKAYGTNGTTVAFWWDNSQLFAVNVKAIASSGTGPYVQMNPSAIFGAADDGASTFAIGAGAGADGIQLHGQRIDADAIFGVDPVTGATRIGSGYSGDGDGTLDIYRGNGAGISRLMPDLLTTLRLQHLPDKSGTFAMTSDLLTNGVVVTHKNGTTTTYTPTADTDTARGTALLNAAAALVAYDVARPSGGIFDLGNNGFIMPVSAALKGAGAGQTVITSSAALGGGAGGVVALSSNSRIESLSLNATNGSAAPLGLVDNTGITNVVVDDCIISGVIDGLYNTIGTNNSIRFYNTKLLSTYDAVNWYRGTAEFFDCDVVVTGPHGTDFARGVVSGLAGNIFFYGGSITVDGSTSENAALEALSSGTIEAHNVRVKVGTSATNNWDINGNVNYNNVTRSDGAPLVINGSGSLRLSRYVIGLGSAGTTSIVSDTAYDATSWDGNLDVPTKNAVRDKFETLSGGGSVTNFSAGDLSPLFTTTEATTTTTPALSFTISNFAAHKFYGNNTGSTAAPAAESITLPDLPAIASVNLVDFSATAPSTAGQIPIYDPAATNSAGGTGAFVPGDPKVQGLTAEAATTASNPINIGGFNTAGTPAIHGATVLNAAPAGTEYGLVVRTISGASSSAGSYIEQDSNATIAKESGGNLATVKTNTDPLVASGGGGYVRQDSTATIAKESGGNLATVASAVRAEDTASADADKGIAALAIRKATPGNTSGTDGDYEYLQESAGRLWVSALVDSALPTGTNVIGALTSNQSVNNNQVGGTAIDTNSGNKSAGTQRVVLATDQPALTNKLLVTPDSVALPANQSVNNNQVGGTAVDTNSGTKSAGTQRVVLATDQPALTNKLLVTPDSVALPANQSVNTNQVGGTAIDTNSGTKSAGTQRVVLATDQPALTNAQPQNQTQVGGTTIDTNSGTKSAGTQRVVLATDQPALTNKLLVTPDSVALPANQSVNANQVGGTAIDTNSGTKSAGTQRVVLATDQPALTNAQPVTPAATENYLGFVGGKAANVSANFTRPADTTAYASGDLIANSTTAGSVAALNYSTMARINDATGMIRRVRIKKSGTSTTNASFRVHFYQNDPALSTGITNGDNGAWSTKEAGYLGSVDVTVDKAFSDAAEGVGVPNNGTEINFVPTSGARNVYALIEARAAYTPGNAEVFTVVAEVLQN